MMIQNSALVVLLLAGSVMADSGLQVVPTVNDQSTFQANPGDTVQVDLKYSQTDPAHPVADPAAVEFLVLFSEPGLTYQGYTWSGGDFDFSQPSSANLPVTLDVDTYTGGSAGHVDVNLQNAYTLEGSYSDPQLVQLKLGIPEDWTAGDVMLTTVPRGFVDESANTLLTIGGSMTLVIPEPTSTAVLLAGLVALGLKRCAPQRSTERNIRAIRQRKE